MNQQIIKTVLLIGGALLGLLLIIGMAVGFKMGSNLAVDTTPTPTESVEQPTVTPVQISTTPGEVSPEPSPTTTQTNEPNIKVFSPRANDKVGTTFTVKGQARVFENQFRIRVANSATKEVLFDKGVMSDAQDAGQFGNFSQDIDLSSANLRSGDTLLLEVFDNSAKDGSEIDKVSVPLKF
jgi:hypothetical protein